MKRNPQCAKSFRVRVSPSDSDIKPRKYKMSARSAPMRRRTKTINRMMIMTTVMIAAIIKVNIPQINLLKNSIFTEVLPQRFQSASGMETPFSE